ncbi:hypothetical protein TKV_c04300 [Thermoanaerobacter kivui]|uniref:Uncharacterized protein n=1 Tax=Thermoanaerobacter kivui TaxID=2325 RepID=A0A097AP81_THEKI|nr:hypothetical protein [Thermoanaerobacter kivui]AIS51632.1 hypothetical protein TKV_c04300 [Thermoanaerobacter kivui]
MYRIETITSKASYKVKIGTFWLFLKNFKTEIEPFLYLLPAASIIYCLYFLSFL